MLPHLTLELFVLISWIFDLERIEGSIFVSVISRSSEISYIILKHSRVYWDVRPDAHTASIGRGWGINGVFETLKLLPWAIKLSANIFTWGCEFGFFFTKCDIAHHVLTFQSPVVYLRLGLTHSSLVKHKFLIRSYILIETSTVTLSNNSIDGRYIFWQVWESRITNANVLRFLRKLQSSSVALIF